MKTLKICKPAAIAAIIGIVIGITACKGGGEPPPPPKPKPQPVEQEKDITIAAGKTVTVKYTALPGVTPAWWNTLETLLQDDMAAGFATGHYILIVEYSGTAGFVAGTPGSKTATVSEAFLATSDYDTMGYSMGPMVSQWISMLNTKVYYPA